MATKWVGWLLAGLTLWWGSAAAIDEALYQKYQSYKSYQQAGQAKLLSQARAAALAGDFDQAEQHLAAARNMAYAPDEIRAVENLIAEERNRREEMARAERQRREEQARAERQRREEQARAERQRREEQAKAERQRQEEQARAEAAERQRREELARAAAAGDAGSSGSDSTGGVASSLDWGYDYSTIYIPPTYKTELKERGFLFREYYWETRQDTPGYTNSSLDRVYFSVKLRNNSKRTVQVTYKITARERFSVSRAISNTYMTGFSAVAGAFLAQMLGADAEVGAAAGAAYQLSKQDAENQWFHKQKTFTVTLKPGEERYETGAFPVNKTLTDSPSLQILSVD